MTNDLTHSSNPQEVIKELKTAYQQVYEENKRLRADIMFLQNGKAELKAERDAYRETLQRMCNHVAYWGKSAAFTAKKVLNQYPSPIKDKP